MTRAIRQLTWLAALALLGGLCVIDAAHAAAPRAIEDVRFVKQSGVARAEIVFACAVRYLSHTPDSGRDVQIRLALEPDCVAEIGTGLRSELLEPPTGNLAGVKRIVFDTTVEERVAWVALDAGRTVRFAVSQGAMRNVVRVELLEPDTVESGDRLPDASAPRATTTAPPGMSASPAPAAAVAAPAPVARAPAPVVTPRAFGAPPAAGDSSAGSAPEAATPAIAEAANPATVEAAPAERRPLRLVQPASARVDRYVLQLAAGSAAAAAGEGLAPTSAEVLYLNERSAGERSWQELRLGFFDSEAAARARLDSLRAQFPDSVIAVASVAEQDEAGARRLYAAQSAAAPPGTSAVGALPELSPERREALAAEANDALIAQSYERAIQIYARLAADPGYEDRRGAQERLGVARERNGQVAQARLEYETYLGEFADGPDAERVRQRLAGLLATTSASRPRAEEIAASESAWDYQGGIAQYYRRDIYEPLDTLPQTEQAALLTNVDLVLRRRGERFDLRTRVDATYRYNMLDATQFDPADQLYLTNAYVDLVDHEHDWSARLGRQSMHTSGVLGRFDGAHAEYQWRPAVGFNLTIGRPVDYPRHAVDNHREFAAFSTDFDKLVKEWDVSFFGMMQNVDGVADRQAVGIETRHSGTAWSVVGLVDADLSYGVLNSALVNANWRPTPKLTFYGRMNFGAAPYLTTHNALIGQTDVSIEEMLQTYDEAQIRRIARERTAQERDAALGFTRPVLDRFELNVDLMFSAYDATVASAGVDALPASGPQTFFQATLVGSSFIKSGDTTIFSLRRQETRAAVSDTFVFDVRLPATRKLRLNPRIALTDRTGTVGEQQWIVAPEMRFMVRWANHHRLDIDLGAQLSDKKLPAPDPALDLPVEQSSAYFAEIGYWWEF
jgi:hypothetical protein